MKIQSLAYCASSVLVALALSGCQSNGIDGDRTGSIGGDGPGNSTVYAKQADGTTLTAAG